MAKQSTSNAVEQTICPTRLSSKHEKNYQKNTLGNIVKAINGLFNTSGGTLELRYDNSPPRGHVKMCKRKIEQKIQDCLGTITLAIDIDIVDIPASSRGHGVIKIFVKTSTKTNNLSTMKYNIFLPSSEQVMEVLPSENVEKLRAILMEKILLEKATEPGSHQKHFVQNESVDFSESKTIQFKWVKDEKQKETTFTSRFTGKSNKFPCYVSAFANYAGGNVYIGINDDGKGKGECLEEEEKKKAEEEIRKVIKKMIWPKKWEPKNGTEDKRWNIHFEPVIDTAGIEIPSLYVVVVFVAQCPGGVFTEMPECYEILNNEVKKMDFAKWKKTIAPRLADEEETRSADAPYDLVYEKLTSLLNNDCKKEELDTASKTAQEEHKCSKVELELTYLSKLVSYYLRKGEFPLAEESLKEYTATLPFTTKKESFKVMEQYLYCIMERCKGNYEKSYDIANNCLEDLRKLDPCVISATFYVQIGTLENILATKAKNREEMKDLLNKAEENYNTANTHLNNIQEHMSNTKAEFEQKIDINKALLYLGSSLTGDMLPDSEELIDIKKAEKHLMNSKAGRLSKFREIQYLFATACLSYRLCMSKPSQKAELLKDAVMYSKIAEYLAEKYKFPEMTTYVKRYINFFEGEQHK